MERNLPGKLSVCRHQHPKPYVTVLVADIGDAGAGEAALHGEVVTRDRAGDARIGEGAAGARGDASCGRSGARRGLANGAHEASVHDSGPGQPPAYTQPSSTI